MDDNDSIMNDFWGRIFGVIFIFPFLFARVPKFDKEFVNHIFTGYKEGEEGYVWSCVHGHCGNAPGFEWTSNAPVLWVFTRLIGVPMGFFCGLICLPFFLLMGAVCWIGELLGKKRGWTL